MQKLSDFDVTDLNEDLNTPILQGAGYTGIMLSTLWNQYGIIELGDNTTVTYNYYCPTDTTAKTQSVTGCTNTAAGQIIYYFIENYDLDLQLTLDEEDEYTSEQNNLVINIKADGSTPGTVSFSVINNKLSEYDINSADDAAALIYACGVVQEAGYSSDETGTAWDAELFMRAGFESISVTRLYHHEKGHHWGYYNSETKAYQLSDAGIEVIIENLLAGRVVGTSFPGHALVIDGYDSSNDTFHINFGWGNADATRWYTRAELREQQYYEFIYDLMPETVENLTVNDPDLYGTGTVLRAFELANSMDGFNRINFTDSAEGATHTVTTRIYSSDSLEVNDFNSSLCLSQTDVMFYHNDDGALTFNDLRGEIIANATGSAYAFYAPQADHISIDMDGALIYAGSYSVSGDYTVGSNTILNELRAAQQQDCAVSDFIISSSNSDGKSAYAIFGSAAADTVTIDNSTIVIGDIQLRDGADTITVSNNSSVYGDIKGTAADQLFIDSSSSVEGAIDRLTVNIALNRTIGSEAIIAVTNISSFSANRNITIDISAAAVGTYILLEAAGSSAAAAADAFNNMSFIITGDDRNDYSFSLADTNEKIQLSVEDNILKLNVLQKVDSTPPNKPTVYADITGMTNRDVTLTAVYSDDSVQREYSYDQQTWFSYTGAIPISTNCTVYFRGTDAAGNISEITEHVVSNIDRVPPNRPEAASDITEMTNQNVTVTAEFSEDSITKEFSRDNETWEAYTDPIVMEANGTIYFRGIDAAGNISEITEHVVSNIDKSGPEPPTASANITTPTLGNVLVSATFGEDSIQCQYSYDNEIWHEYTGPVEMQDNGSVFFRGFNTKGNPSIVTEYVVSNIDRVPPEIPTIVPSTEQPTNQTVIVRADFTEDSVVREFSYDGETWQRYYSALPINDNNTTIYFRAADILGNTSEVVSCTVSNIDRSAPEKPSAAANTRELTNQNVTVTAEFSDDTAVKEFSYDNNIWQTYTAPVEIEQNCIIYFRGTDAAGNFSETTEYIIGNIDKSAPLTPKAEADIYELTTGDVFVRAIFDATAFRNEYSRDNEVWFEYTGAVKMTDNGTVYFRSSDQAGNDSAVKKYIVANIDKSAPDIVENISVATIDNQANILWNIPADNGIAGIGSFRFRFGTTDELSGDGELLTGNSKVITGLDAGDYYFQVKAIDRLGNESEWSEVMDFSIQLSYPTRLAGTVDGFTWYPAADSENYTVEFSKDNFVYSLVLNSGTTAVDVFGMPTGVYRWKVQSATDDKWSNGNNIICSTTAATPETFTSDADGALDLFFAKNKGVWGKGYKAAYQGYAEVETEVVLLGKNRITDIFAGSEDANILVMTDDANGDALFLDDTVFSGIGTQKLSQIDEIRAGAGDDIIDLTSAGFTCSQDEMRIFGGGGNDTIWADDCSNIIYGDAGNDSIIGGSSDDIIVGGSGNDTLHGGGGDDLFTFGGNWGNDTVEQLAGGTVRLWIEDYDENNWDEENLTYTDGDNTITVIGTDNIIFELEDTANAFAGAFTDAASDRIFEDKNKGYIA